MKKNIFACDLESWVLPVVYERSQAELCKSRFILSLNPGERVVNLWKWANTSCLLFCYSAVQRTFDALTNLRVSVSKRCAFDSLPWSLRKWFKKFFLFNFPTLKVQGLKKLHWDESPVFSCFFVGLVKTTLFSLSLWFSKRSLKNHHH